MPARVEPQGHSPHHIPPQAAARSKLSWGYSSLGIPGLIDTPSAFSRQDGEFALLASHIRNQTRYTLTFQITERLSSTFRYAQIRYRSGNERRDHYDRSFSLQWRLFDETRLSPALAIGINDLLGTGFYGGEYLVAAKTLTPRLRAALGIGWGRLASHGSFDNPLAAFGAQLKTRPQNATHIGGTFQPQTWFRGPAAVFGGIEWRASDQLRLMAEYSSDAYLREQGAAFNRRSAVNLGLDWYITPATTLALRYLYGAELGFQLTHALHPGQERPSLGADAGSSPRASPHSGQRAGTKAAASAKAAARSSPRPGPARPSLAFPGLVFPALAFPGLAPAAPPQPDPLRPAPERIPRRDELPKDLAPDAAPEPAATPSPPLAPPLAHHDLANALARQGLVLEGLQTRGAKASIQIHNTLYDQPAQAIGRAARVLAAIAPAEIGVFEIYLSLHGMPVTAVTLHRADLAPPDADPRSAPALNAAAHLRHAPQSLPHLAQAWPKFSYALEPYITPSLFDPHNALRADLGLLLSAQYAPRPGLILTASLSQKLAGNLAAANRASTSQLPHVRSDGYLYHKGSETRLRELTANWVSRPAPNLFARLSIGYFEMMHAGISAELLWRPPESRLAFGAEINQTRQRDYHGGFGLLDQKSVTSGHLSAYYVSPKGYEARLDLGRYLAADVGATLTLARTFPTGWRIGAFATKTNVAAETFGEGAFDKGIEITIPIAWASGKPTLRKTNITLRPVQRDGGARLSVPHRLWQSTNDLTPQAIRATWHTFLR